MSRTRSVRRAPPPWVWLAALALVGATAAYRALDASSRRAPELAPRHRPEALCFLLAQPPEFAPPMAVTPSAALIRGRFGRDTPPSFALQQVMHFDDSMVLRRWSRAVGDFRVSAFWLRLPGAEREHWLVLAWMEDADLAICNFRFAGTSRALDSDQRAWGQRLLLRLLRPENFQRGQIPDARLRVTDGATMPVYGPTASR